MKSALAGTVERARSTLSTISLGQKVVIGLLLVGLLLGGFFFFRWITAPTQAPLFSNLASADASAIVDELNAAGVAYELTDGGQTIMVAKDSVYDLRLSMSGKGLPAGQDTGYALLDEQGITTSEFQQQVTYQRALEGELSKTLESLDGVRSAVVHVALPEDEVFVTDQAEPTASVLLDLAPGTALSGEQIQAVTNLVSSSVQDMEPDQVTVADSTGQVLSAAGEGMTAAAGDARSQVEQDYENRLSENAQQILDRVVGPGRAVVSVRADVDLSERETTSETYTYDEGTPPISESTTTEDYTGGGVPVGGVLGPENMPDAAANAGAGDSTYNKESTTVEQRRRQDRGGREGRARRPQAAHRLGGHGRVGRRQPQPAADARPHDHRRRPGRGPGRRHHRRLAALRHDRGRRRRRRHGGRPRGRGQRGDVVDDPLRRHRGRHRARRPPGLAALPPDRARSRRTTSPSSSATTCCSSSTGCASRAPARRPRPRSTPRQLELEAAERQKVRGEIADHGQREARRGRGHAPRLAEREQVVTTRTTHSPPRPAAGDRQRGGGMSIASVEALVGLGGGLPAPVAPPAPRPELPGLRKAAVFLAQMSKEEAGVLLSKLRPREVEALTRELMRLGSVEPDDVDGVMNEFHGLMTAQHFIGRGGVDFAREILAAGLGEDKAGDILSRLNVVYTEVPFASLRNADVRQLVTFLKDEHAQIIALVLAHLTAGAVGRGAVRASPRSSRPRSRTGSP